MEDKLTKRASPGSQREDHTPSTEGQGSPQEQRGYNELSVASGESTATSVRQPAALHSPPATFMPASVFESHPSISISEPMLASFVVVAYNQEKYIREAVEGAFSQTYSRLEIILSDDCSTDSTFAIMQEMAREYKGPHKVILNRNERNKGLPAHVNITTQLMSGEVWIAAAGDDISSPYRSSMLMDKFAHDKHVIACFSYSRLFGDVKEEDVCPYHDTTIHGPLMAAWCAGIPNGSTMAYRQIVFDRFGPLSDSAIGEDMALFYRSLFLGRCDFVSEILVHRRRHPEAMGHVINSNDLRRWRQIRKAQWKSVIDDLQKLNLPTHMRMLCMSGFLLKSTIDSLNYGDEFFFALFPRYLLRMIQRSGTRFFKYYCKRADLC